MSFAVDLERIAKKIGRSLDTTRRGVCIQLFSDVVALSPVDEGRFRGNWQTSVASPISGTTDRLDRASYGSPPGSDVKAEINNNLGQLGDVVYFTNNLPYALRLEYGHSGQAPAGMARVNVARFETLLAQEASKHK